MANLLLTQRCVRSCPYCFAQKYMDGVENAFISWDAVVRVADLHVKSKEPCISLLGGEPTLHPNYVDIVLYLLERGLHVNTFTSGVTSKNKLEELTTNVLGIDPMRLSFVVNYNDPAISPESETERINAFFKALGPYTSLSFNIYQSRFDMTHLFDAIINYSLRRHIRIGLAQPIVGMENVCVPKEEFQVMAKQMMSFLPTMTALRVKMGFDCGIPLCIFDDEDLGQLYKMMLGRLDFKCGAAIDIGPDLSVWPCFPLSQWHRKHLSDFSSLTEVREYYNLMHGRVRGELAGMYDKCEQCVYREEGLCSGGCLSHQISTFETEEGVRFPEVYLDSNKPTTAPSLNQKI